MTKRSCVAVLFTLISWVYCASSSPTPCHKLQCQNSDNNGGGGGHGMRLTNNTNISLRNDIPAIRFTSHVPENIDAFYNNEVEVWLNQKQAEIEKTVFVSYDSQGNAHQSKSYAYDDFIKTMKPMSVGGVGGGDDRIFFYLGQTDGKGIVHGLVNVAAFLAHAMAVSIRYDVCDEFSMDATDFTQKYAISNSCGQWGRSYQDEACVGDDAFMSCDVDVDITITAADSLEGAKTPPPLECRPKVNESDFTGHWDAKLGILSETYPYANRVGVMHTEGCCWWGRGVLLTRGTCNFGRLNHYLGRKAAAQGFPYFYDVDLCLWPEVVCSHHDTMGLRWSVGYFEWADRVQTYQNALEGLDYMEDLDTFVESGFVDINRFIDVVGKALPFGCIEANCWAAEEKVKYERRDNFVNLVFNVLNLPHLVESTPFPTPPPTTKPTNDSTMPPSMWPTRRPPPTRHPTLSPKAAPPTQVPSAKPSAGRFPTAPPTPHPTKYHIASPSGRPTQFATPKPTTEQVPQTQLPTVKPTIRQTLPTPDTVTDGTICNGQSSSVIPINECREYVQCANGYVISQQFCSAGLLFDTSIGSCNWSSVVTCNTPTKRPMAEPTWQTPRPTQKMPGPTQQTPKLTQQPVGIDRQTDTLPKMSQLPPTFSPSIKVVQFTSVRPMAADGRPQEEESNEPSYLPTSIFERDDLINLPSAASLGTSGSIVLSIGIYFVAVLGILTILS